MKKRKVMSIVFASRINMPTCMVRNCISGFPFALLREVVCYNNKAYLGSLKLIN